MRRLHQTLLMAALPALALGLTLGCGGSKETGGTPEKEKKGATTSAKKEKGSKGHAFTLVEGKGTGTLTGKVTLAGAKPETVLKALSDKIKKQMEEKKDDLSHCLKGSPQEVASQTYFFGDNNQVGNVFVWIEPVEDGAQFKVPQAQIDAVKGKTVKMRQPHCAFLPHALTLFPSYYDDKGKLKPTGEKFEVINDADISHNTKLLDTSLNQILAPGKELPVPQQTLDEKVKRKTPLVVQCTIHGWMDAYVRCYPHPWATVSKAADDKGNYLSTSDKAIGTYEIKDVPAGLKVRIMAWHEKAGYLNGQQGETIELKEGANEKNFEMKAPTE